MKALFFQNHNVPKRFLDHVRTIPGLELTVVDHWKRLRGRERLEMIRRHHILIASRSPRVPNELADDPGFLKYICYLHGTMRKVIGLPIIRSGIVVTNWGAAPANGLALASITLLLAVFRDLHKRIMAVRRGEGRGIVSAGDTLKNVRVGVYGFGFGGREFVRLLEPFGSAIFIYDPYASDIPPYCTRVASLRELFARCQVIVIHAALTAETRKSVTRELLALLPDQGIIINTARGAIIDQKALFDELRSGRLRAGLDVLWPDDLPPDHEARQWENLIWTCHEFRGKPWSEAGADSGLSASLQVCLENIRAFVEGKPLQYVVDEVRYTRMT